ncbi:MAG: HlyD family type I secretion periplasmic adaptor subunit [Saprospiraceae bacterium]|nr:MAG: HlyD family type I secretion periplasmic adaptor subunit [Saprospiraceae bacterium]
MAKSDYLNDILEKTPIWIIRWGNTLFLVFILGLFALGYFIQYPDFITARLELVTKNPPIEVKAIITGKMDTILLKDQAEVKKEQLLARLNSIARYEDVLLAKKAIRKCLAVEEFSGYVNTDFPTDLELGELATTYNTFQREFVNLRFSLQQDYVFQKISSLEKEIKKIYLLNTSLKRQELMHEEEVGLAQINLERNQQMHKEGLISDVEMEAIEREQLGIKRAFENARMQQVENELQIERLEIQKAELLNDRSQNINTQVQRIRELLNELQSQISAWEETYVLRAPIAGILSYDLLLADEKPVLAGETVFNIVPKEQDNQIVGLCNMPLRNSGEVKIGTIVQVQLDAYPYREYGILEGSIASIAAISQRTEDDQAFSRVEIAFSDTLRTTFGQPVPFTQKMTGTALIIKEKKSILERIFEQILSLFE